MHILPERIDWMPSPPLAPDETPIDVTHLQRATLSDAGLEREILTLFARQTARLMARLADRPADALALLHTLKGSALGIGAFAVARAADDLDADLREARSGGAALARLRQAVDEAGVAIDGLLRTN